MWCGVECVENNPHLYLMKMKECPSCAMQVDAGSKTCPICRYEFTASGGGRKWIAVFLLVLAILWLLITIL